MLAKLQTFSLLGIKAVPVEVEVDVSGAALPKTVLVGLPEAAVKESTHRIERALVNSGYVRPADRVVINLAPAELPKQAASFDLPIALGVLAASGQLGFEQLAQYTVVGELALDGTTRPVKGGLSMAMAAAASRQRNSIQRNSIQRGLVVPTSSAPEAAVVEGIQGIPVDTLAQAAAFFRGEVDIAPYPSRVEQLFRELGSYDIDFADVRGQEMAKRALTLAAAGGPRGAFLKAFVVRAARCAAAGPPSCSPWTSSSTRSSPSPRTAPGAAARPRRRARRPRACWPTSCAPRPRWPRGAPCAAPACEAVRP